MNSEPIFIKLVGPQWGEGRVRFENPKPSKLFWRAISQTVSSYLFREISEMKHSFEGKWKDEGKNQKKRDKKRGREEVTRRTRDILKIFHLIKNIFKERKLISRVKSLKIASSENFKYFASLVRILREQILKF